MNDIEKKIEALKTEFLGKLEDLQNEVEMQREQEEPKPWNPEIGESYFFGDLETKDQLSIEKLINAVGQLEDLRCDREGFAADFEDEEDNAFRFDVAAIDTALAAIKRLIKLEYEKE